MAYITDLVLNLGEAYTLEWEYPKRDEDKIDCYPDQDGATKEKCIARGCTWEVKTVLINIKTLYTLQFHEHSTSIHVTP